MEELRKIHGHQSTLAHTGRWLAAVAAATLMLLMAPNAKAYCGSVTSGTTAGITGNGDIVVLGLDGTFNYSFTFGGQLYCVYTYGTNLGACMKPAAGGATTHYTVTGCTTSTGVGSPVYVATAGGDDKLAPAPINTEIPCGTVTNGCAAYAVYGGATTWPFSFGMFAEMGNGSDTAYGTPIADTLMSSVNGSFPNFNPGDSSYDMLCGFAGADTLYGDQDDSASNYECLLGGSPSSGSPSDWCQQFQGTNDEASECETLAEGAGHTHSLTAPCSTAATYVCNTGNYAPNIW